LRLKQGLNQWCKKRDEVITEMAEVITIVKMTRLHGSVGDSADDFEKYERFLMQQAYKLSNVTFCWDYRPSAIVVACKLKLIKC
jgi:hypothetical protein